MYSDTHPGCKDPCRPPIASQWRYTTILNSEMNSHLLYNMCASVPADFCRPTGLESARPRPGTYSLWNHQGYHKTISVWKNSVLLSVWKAMSHWVVTHPHKHYHIGAYIYHDYRLALQAVFSVVCMSVTMVSQYESSKQLNSE